MSIARDPHTSMSCGCAVTWIGKDLQKGSALGGLDDFQVKLQPKGE